MSKMAWLGIDGLRYELEEIEVGLWRLYWECSRKALNEYAAHPLDYWQKKGVILK